MKRKRPEQTTPKIKYNAYAKDYEKALVAFVRAMAKSAGYHITAALKRQGIITEDASIVNNENPAGTRPLTNAALQRACNCC